MKGPVEEGVIKKQTAALRPALWLSTDYKLTGRGHSETCREKNSIHGISEILNQTPM